MAAEGDWRSTKTVTECLGHLCLSETMSDVVFTFPNSDARLHAHKVVLGMRSAVFEAMFYGPMAEKGLEIQIKDGGPEAFEVLLRYIYTDSADLKESTVLKCLYVGRKYCVDGFVQACSTYLETSISVENVLTIYEQAYHFDMPDLQERSMRFIAGYAEDILKSEELLTISNKTLIALLDRDDLVAEEISVFEAAVRWAKHKCAKNEDDDSPDNMRRCLGDAFYCIRLPVIPMQDFAETVGPSQLLSEREEIQLYRHIATAANKGSELTSVGKYKAKIRKFRLAEVCFEQVSFTRSEFLFSPPAQHINMLVSPSSSIKLHSISGSIFKHGVKGVYHNGSMIAPEKWRVEGSKLILGGGLKFNEGVHNEIKCSLLNHGTVTERFRTSRTFNVLSGQVNIQYGEYTEGRLESMVFF